MRNQTSFRLTTTLLPTDMTAKTTTVINKVDSTGAKFLPNFTEETVVLTNDDRTVMETTRATCTDWVLTFTKRWLSDDSSETQIPNRKLTWNPWSLCFITAGSWDWIDKDDNLTWTGNQTYTGNLISQWNATYNGLLTTNKWVKYPSFANVEELEAYWQPFGWMFATVDSTWELYRYNAVTEERALIESSEPANPEMADETTIWTVRVATDAEFAAWTETWDSWEYLVATPAQIQSVSPSMSLNFTNVNLSSSSVHTAWQTASVTYTVPHDWFVTIRRTEYINNSSMADYSAANRISLSWASDPKRVTFMQPDPQYFSSWHAFTNSAWFHVDLYAVKAGTLTVTMNIDYTIDSSYYWWVKIQDFFYFW